MEVKEFTAEGDLMSALVEGHQGVFSFMVMPPEVVNRGIDLKTAYGKKGLALKVFRAKEDILDGFVWAHSGKWRGHLLSTVSMIQNVLAIRGLAPRVYDIVKITDDNRSYFAQVTDFVEGVRGEKPSAENVEKFKYVQNKFTVRFGGDPNIFNFVGGQWVDFGTFGFDYEKYKTDVLERVNKYADYGSRPESYQAVEEFNIPSQRNMEHRVGVYKFDEHDFKGRSVIDIGSSSGTFCREAVRRGASRVVGIEYFDELVEVQKDLCNLLGRPYWNIDFFNVNCSTKPNQTPTEVVHKNLVEATGRDNFDIVIFVSMVQHVGFPHYIGKFCKEWFLLEGNVAQHYYHFEDDMKKYFKEVRVLDGTKDHMPRAVVKGIK